MKRTVIRCSTLIAALMLTLLARQAAAAPDGIAPYVELQRELFLAGLYLPEPATSAQQAVALRGSRQMEIRFVAERMTAGKLSRLFLQSIAINNSVAAQRASGESLASFFNAFKGSLRTGDILAISERTDGSGVNVYLNRERLVGLTDPNFFNLLLVTWIGSVPPSREFKHALLGNSAPGDIARYVQLAPAQGRLSLVEQWQNPAAAVVADSPQSKAVPDKPAVASAQTNSQASVAAMPAVAAVSIPSPTPTAKIAASLPASVSKTPSPEAAVSAKAGSVSASALTPTPAESAASSAAKATSSQSLVVAEQKPVKVRELAEPEEDLPDFSVESLELLQNYTAQLVALTHAEIKYPRRAMKLQQTGSVRMAVVLDTEGTVLEVQPLLESGHKQLDDAVRRAIEKAAPYPAIPADLMTEHFEFVFPITFMLEHS